MDMLITKQMVVHKLDAYLQGRQTLDQIADWAEQAMMEGRLADDNDKRLWNVIAQIGLADVRAFGIDWESLKNWLFDLDCTTRITIEPRT